jgi:hypothetical protein
VEHRRRGIVGSGAHGDADLWVLVDDELRNNVQLEVAEAMAKRRATR